MQLYPCRDTFEFDQGHVTKNQSITVLILLSESLAIYIVWQFLISTYNVYIYMHTSPTGDVFMVSPQSNLRISKDLLSTFLQTRPYNRSWNDYYYHWSINNQLHSHCSLQHLQMYLMNLKVHEQLFLVNTVFIGPGIPLGPNVLEK